MSGVISIRDVTSMRGVVGLDLGTTHVTGVLVDTAQRQVVRHAQRPNDAATKPVFPTRAEQNPRRLRALALEVLAELVGDGTPADGIALTGQMHGVLCVDAGGAPVTPLISWQDQRTGERQPGSLTALDRLNNRLDDLAPRQSSEQAWHENGCRIDHGYGAAILFGLVEQGELPAATHRLCTLPGWMAAQLSGTLPVTDPTLAASWGVYSLPGGGWNVAFLNALGLDTQLMPPVRPSGEPLGGLLPELARRVGMQAGIPVLNAVGDTQAAFLGSVRDPAQEILFNLGTGGQICWMLPEFAPPTRAVETRPLPGGRCLRVGASLCGGAAYAWLNHTVRGWLSDFGVHAEGQAIYERLNTLAMSCSDAGSLRVRTTFLGRRGDDTVQAGSIEGLTMDNLQLGALARATLTGIVDELYDLYKAHTVETASYSRLVATGGGLRRNPLLPGLIEERFGLPVHVPQQRGNAALGAAGLALQP
jgi:sugar (pentulose or hexulose) kinase